MFLPNSLFHLMWVRYTYRQKEPQFLRNYWWLTEVPYWFKTDFLPKILGIYGSRGEKDNFARGKPGEFFFTP